jgi:Fibronectin type III domain
MSITRFVKSLSITFVVSALSLGSLVSAAYAAPAPDAPGNVVAKAGNSQITVTWDAATTSGAAVTGYKVLLSHANGTGSVPALCFTTVARTCVFAGLTNGTSYFVTVEAMSSSEISPASTQLTVMPVGPSTAPAISRILRKVELSNCLLGCQHQPVGQLSLPINTHSPGETLGALFQCRLL